MQLLNRNSRRALCKWMFCVMLELSFKNFQFLHKKRKENFSFYRCRNSNLTFAYL